MILTVPKNLLPSQFLTGTENKQLQRNVRVITHSKKSKTKEEQDLERKTFNLVNDWCDVREFGDLIKLNFIYFKYSYSCPIIGKKMAELSCYGLFITHLESPLHKYTQRVEETKLVSNKSYKGCWMDIENRGYIGFYIDISKDNALSNFIFNKLDSMRVIYTSSNLKTDQKLTNMRKGEEHIIIGRKRTYSVRNSPRDSEWETTRLFPQSIPVEEYYLMKMPNIQRILENTICVGVTSLKLSKVSFLDVLLNLCRTTLKKKYNF